MRKTILDLNVKRNNMKNEKQKNDVIGCGENSHKFQKVGEKILDHDPLDGQFNQEWVVILACEKCGKIIKNSEYYKV